MSHQAVFVIRILVKKLNYLVVIRLFDLTGKLRYLFDLFFARKSFKYSVIVASVFYWRVVA